MRFLHATGSPDPLPLSASDRRYFSFKPAVFTRETLRAADNPTALLNRALIQKEDKLVIAQIIAERLGRRERADWALAIATQAAKKVNDARATILVSRACLAYGGFKEAGDVETFRALRVDMVERLAEGRGNGRVKRVVVGLNYFLARAQRLLEGDDLLLLFEPECLVYLLHHLQPRRDSFYPMDKMLRKGVGLLSRGHR